MRIIKKGLLSDSGPPILDGVQWQRVVANVRMEGETASEEVASLASDRARLHQLLDGLQPVDLGRATALFQSLGASESHLRDNKYAVFAGFIQAAIGEERADISAWLLTVPYLGDKSNVLLVHNSDKVIPVSLLSCSLGDRGYLAALVTGSELIETLLRAD